MWMKPGSPASAATKRHKNNTKSPGFLPGISDCRKTYITKRVVRPTPINPQKAATCAWLFALLKGQVCAKGVHTAPCKNSKKWPKPLFRHAQTEPFRLRFVLFTAIRSADFSLFPSSPARSDPVLGQKWVKHGALAPTPTASRRPSRRRRQQDRPRRPHHSCSPAEYR